MSPGNAYPPPRSCSRRTMLGYVNYLKGIRRSQTLFRAGPHLEEVASKSWQVAPGSSTRASRAFSLPGQLERVSGMAYTDNPARDMQGGFEVHHAATRGFELKNVWLLDGALYQGVWRLDMYARGRLTRTRRYFPTTSVRQELDRAAIYSSYDGNEFFGLWLTDDCTTYPLAADEGVPITSNQPASTHTLEYEALFGMSVVRADAAYLKEAVLFDDNWGNNTSKHLRFSQLRQRLLAATPATPHPGVFILRRGSGKSRIMRNELKVAEFLREKRGFRIVDVTTNSVSEILAACAGARVLAGIEGSHLMHGLMVLEPGASILTLQPPQRFCSVLKLTTDMEGQHYAFVVGTPVEGGFEVDESEIKRTLDLLPASTRV